MDNAKVYAELAAINVSEHIEKKGRFNYLSWVYAVDVLLRHDPMATWNFITPREFPDGTMMVFCAVTAFGKTMTAQLPVMNNQNRAITTPNAFDVNTAMQRCLAKAIALHGLGLYIYAGEDLPHDEESGNNIRVIKPPNESSKSIARDVFDKTDEDMQIKLTGIADDVKALMGKPTEAYEFLESQDLDADQKVALWSLLDSRERAALKKVGQERKAL